MWKTPTHCCLARGMGMCVFWKVSFWGRCLKRNCRNTNVDRGHWISPIQKLFNLLLVSGETIAKFGVTHGK